MYFVLLILLFLFFFFLHIKIHFINGNISSSIRQKKRFDRHLMPNRSSFSLLNLFIYFLLLLHFCFYFIVLCFIWRNANLSQFQLIEWLALFNLCTSLALHTMNNVVKWLRQTKKLRKLSWYTFRTWTFYRCNAMTFITRTFYC